MLQKEYKTQAYCSTYSILYVNNITNIIIMRKRQIAQIVLQDMIFLIKGWRHLKGYPCNGQTTHTNASNSKKNNLLLKFRINQFIKLFGSKKKHMHSILIVCEYTNKLWFHTWFYEWLQSYKFVLKFITEKRNFIPFNPYKLAKNYTNGYVRVGAAAKLGKSKKITKYCTIGLPLFFTKYIYSEDLLPQYPFKFQIITENTICY